MKIKAFLIFTFLFILCGNKPTNDEIYDKVNANDTYIKVQNKDSVTFFWDAVHNYFDTVQYYELFYHTVSDSSWKSIKDSIPQADSPRVVVYRNEIDSDDSVLIFGVRGITMEGVSSDICSSEDSTAIPYKWALLWYKK